MNRTDKLIINGNKKLFGDVTVSGAKNAALPLMALSILFDNGFELNNVPNLLDTKTMINLLNDVGIKNTFSYGTIKFFGNVSRFHASEDLVKKMRASILILSPLLQTMKSARVPLPGGCAIGSRPIDLHIEVVKSLGAKVEFKNGCLEASLPYGNFIGNKIVFPKISVGATECGIMAGVMAKGNTTLVNVAKEPEVIDLGNCLKKAGAKIHGLGENVIRIQGVNLLKPIKYSVIPDRIEAGSFAVAAAMTKGEINIKNVNYKHLESFLEKIKKSGAFIELAENEIKVIGSKEIKSVNISTEPHPGFPTDLQAQFMSLMCLSNGKSSIKENIFENRFQHVPELRKMGAKILVKKKEAFVYGLKKLYPAKVIATDLRASMSLIIACLATKGKSQIFDLEHLKRGYEDIENKLFKLGADLS